MFRALTLGADASDTGLCRSVGCARTPEPAHGHAETNAHRLSRRFRALYPPPVTHAVYGHHVIRNSARCRFYNVLY